MKKVLLFLMVATLGCGAVYSQAKKTPVKRSQTNVSAKAKAVAEAKAKAEAEAKAKAEAEEVEAQKIAFNNSNCRFGFGTGKFVSMQSSNDGFVIYEIPNMSASELKSSVFTTLSSTYKSPKDAITSLNDNMIQLEGYATNVYSTEGSSRSYSNDILFSLVIQFKDGKVRYNEPVIKQIYTELPPYKMTKLDMSKPLSTLIDDYKSRKSVADYFNNLIQSINAKLVKSNDW